MNKTTIAPGIVSYDNVMDDPKGFIDYIEGSRLTWNPAQAVDGTTGKILEFETRRCFEMGIPPNYTSNNPNDPLLQIKHKLDRFVMPLVNDYKEEYQAKAWDTLEGWHILKYNEGHFFNNHYDDSKAYPRTVSLSFYMNDDYEGGEIEFPFFNLKIKPKANQLILFPSNYAYKHSVHPVVSGTRYAIVAWWG